MIRINSLTKGGAPVRAAYSSFQHTFRKVRPDGAAASYTFVRRSGYREPLDAGENSLRRSHRKVPAFMAAPPAPRCGRAQFASLPPPQAPRFGLRANIRLPGHVSASSMFHVEHPYRERVGRLQRVHHRSNAVCYRR